MLKSNFTGETMIFKNDKGFYATSISKTKKNPDGSIGYDNAYINVSFRKGVDIPNKTKINVTNGWLTFDIVEHKQTGKKETYWKLYINEYTAPGAQSVQNAQPVQDVMTSSNYNDDLPF